MNRVASAILLVAMSACGHTPTVSHSLRAAEISLKGVDVRLDADAQRWAELADGAIERCESAAKSARAECLGEVAKSGRAAELADDIRDRYDRIVDDLQKAKAAAAELQQMHDVAEKEASAQ